jgi:hypothetical protein
VKKNDERVAGKLEIMRRFKSMYSYLSSTHDDDMRCEAPSSWQSVPFPLLHLWSTSQAGKVNNFQTSKLTDDERETLIAAGLHETLLNHTVDD